MRTTSSKLDTSQLTANQAADLRCRTALELKDRSEYDAAREAMFPLWNGIIGSRPDTKELHESLVPEVFLTTGILTGWLGSRSEIKEADDYARDLITEKYQALRSTRRLKKGGRSESRDGRSQSESENELRASWFPHSRQSDPLNDQSLS